MWPRAERRKNPKVNRIGSWGFPKGWNSLPNPASLKDTELSELINGIYLQYGTIAKRQGTQLQGERTFNSMNVNNGGMFYDIGGQDYMVRVNDSGRVEQYDFVSDSWSLLTGTPPTEYTGNDPEFVSDSPIFDSSVFINIIQVQNKIYFASELDRVTIFDGTDWEVHTELADPTVYPTVAKTGSGTGTRTYYYRYAWLNEFGVTLASPATTTESEGQGWYGDMPEIDGSTFLTLTIPTAPTGAVRTMIFRGDTAENEFFLASIAAGTTTYVDKDTNPDGQVGTDLTFTVPEANTTEGYFFYLLENYQNMLVGTTTHFGKDVLVWSGEQQILDETMTGNLSFAIPDGAGFDGYQRGDGQSINALQAFSVANEDGLAVFKDNRAGLMKGDVEGGFNIQNVNVIRGTMSPKSPHVAGNNIRFYSQDGVATLGHEQNYGTILRYSVLSLKADSVTRRVTTSNLPKVCSEYFNNLSFFGISTGTSTQGNDSILVYDERYDTWSHWTGLHPSVFWKAKHPTTKVENIYFGVSNASDDYGGNVVKMFTGRTDYATSSGTGQKITLSVTTKQYDGSLPDKFKKFDKAVIVFGSLFGNGTTVQAFGNGSKGGIQFPRYRVSSDPILSGFGNDEWGNQEVGAMREDDVGETLLIKEYNLRQKDLFWAKLNIQNDGIEDEVTILGIFFYYMDSSRQLPGRTRLRTLA
jgi:hypothetical protein